MAEAMNLDVDLTALHDAIVADIKTQYPVFKTVEFYSEQRKGLPLPACVLELSDWDASEEDDRGTEQQPVIARFEAMIIMGALTPKVKLEARKMAAAMSSWLRARRWTDAANPGKKLPTGAAEFVSAAPDHFDPDLDQFEVWKVEWRQLLHLGESVFKPGGTAPTDVFVGCGPDIGQANEAKYEPLDVPDLYRDAAVAGVESTSAAVDELDATINNVLTKL